MGAGASRDGEEVEVDDRYVSQSRSGSASGPTSPRSRSDKKSVGQVRKPSRMSLSRNAEGQEDLIIAVTRNGFSVPEITVMEGQAVIFVWQEERMDIVQVIHDGEKLRPVIGGFSGNYSSCDGQYVQQFNLEGEYKFALSGVRCTPLLVTVRRKVDLIAEVTDAGFQPDIICIDQGHCIKWQWKNCSSPHSVQEVKYEMSKACFKKDPDTAGNIKTVSGSYRHQFPRPGLYFFMTEGSELGRRHFCAVQVRETQREFRVEILDRSYQPMILLIEEGDRVWWSWDKQKCKKHHSVYQIEAPALNQSDDDPYVPVKDGFRWTTPSKQGLMSYEFFKPGVYYFSDQNFQEAAEYIGTIIVKPKQKELFVELTENGFNPDLVYAQTGDRIWWTWDGAAACVNFKSPQLFALMETEACLNPSSRKSSAKEGEEVYQYLDDESLTLLTKVGLATTHFSTIGVYHYRVAESPDSLNTCSVIVNPGPKNHTIHLTDNGFEPKVITVRPNDRVWWVWQSGKKQHNILQVSHQGVPIENGFCSGSARDAPSAFVHQFMTPGVFYFLSHSLPKLFGAIVVSTQPQVHEVNVGVEIKPDPVTVKLNDIVCWIFRSLRQHSVSRVESIDQIAGNEIQDVMVQPRRCMSKAITKSGVQHFYSRSFTKGKREKENFIDDIKISSVVCDERYDNAVVRIDKNGFHPAVYYIQKSQSVMWVWKGGEDEAHNVIHVKSPDSDEPLNVIHGAKSFNSGKPVPNNSFLYTFDEDGSYTVASQGAPGFFCTIVVLDVGMRVKEPYLDSSVTGGTVDAGTKVFLSCDTPGSCIYYTTDGSPPELHQESVKLYRPENGIALRRSGLTFVRAMATKEGRLNSHIYTSNRFWVMGDGDDRRSESSENFVRDVKGSQRTSAKTWDWWGCIPAIKACFTNPGTLEVFWDAPEPGHLALIKGYQLFLNGVSYCDMFPPTNNSLRVSGMAGGRTYDIVVEVYSKKPDCQPQKSNKLRMKCPLKTSDDGPVISLERSDKSDTLAIVWMSIDTPQNPISGYLVFLNDQQCGKRLVPDPESNRCKVVIGSCELEKPYKVFVVAVPEESDEVLMSNVLEVILPLDSHEIRLPPHDSRADEEELYLEYLEVNEGSGYLPAMDNKSRVSVEKRDHSFITESPVHSPLHRNTPPPPLSPVGQRERTPILPKESRPPPVIYDALAGDEVRKSPQHTEEDSRYRDGVSPLRKESAKFRSKSFEEDESSRKSSDRISSGISSYLARQRSRSHSPAQAPRQDAKTGGKISFGAVGQVARVGAKVPKLDLSEQTKRRALTFKAVCKAIIAFIRQEKILRCAVGPVKLQKPGRYDLKRLKQYIERNKSFTDALSKTKEIEVRAPGAKPGKGMAGFFAAANAATAAAKTVQQVKALGGKKGGFVKQMNEELSAPAGRPQAAATPGTSVDTPGPSGRPTRDEGYVSNQEYERDRRFPPDYRYYDGYPRDPRDPIERFYRDYPYHGRYTPPWEMRYREEYEDFYRRDQGYDTLRSRDRRAFEDYYRREVDSERIREYYRRKLAEEDQGEIPTDYSKVPHGERYKLPPHDYVSSHRRSMRSPDGYHRDRSYSPAEDKSLRFQDSSPEDTQRSRRDRRRGEGDGRFEYGNQRDSCVSHKSPDGYIRKDERGKPSMQKSNPGDDTFRESMRTPEEYRWARGKEVKKTSQQGHGPRHREALRYSRSFDRSYRGEYRRYPDPREEEAKMRAIAVYASAMGGVNDDGDQSVMTDDNEKSTQTSSQTPQKQRFRPQLDHDFIPPSLQEKGVFPRVRRRSVSESESETETETETDSEMEEDTLDRSRSMVVMDAQKPQAPNLAVRKEKKTPRTPRSGREFETPRQRGISVIRDGREYVEVENDATSTSTDREGLPPHPQEVPSYDKPRKKRKNMAIIEVQEAVELDAKRNEESMEEERQVAVPAVTKESMRQIDEGEFIRSDGDGILPAPSIMVESHGKSGVRVVWDLPKEPDPEYHLLLYVVNVIGTRFTGDINSDISFECNIVERGKQVRGVQHCWNIQDKKRCTIAGLVPGLTYRLYVIANYTLVHGEQPCEIQTTSSVIYYTTVGPPKPPKLRVVSVDMHQALLEWEPPRLHEDLQLKGYRIYVDNKPLGGVRSKETQQMMINNLVPGKTLSVYVVAVTKQADQESDPSRVIHITCPRQPPPITIAQQPAYKQGCVLISWDRPKGHTFATNEEDISLYGGKKAGTSDNKGTSELNGKAEEGVRQIGNNNSEASKMEGKKDVKPPLKEHTKIESKETPKQIALLQGDDQKAIEIGSKDIKGHGYQRKKEEGHADDQKRWRSEKGMKHKSLEDSSSDHSSTSQSESASASESDYSVGPQHHLSDDRQVNRYGKEPDIAGEKREGFRQKMPEREKKIINFQNGVYYWSSSISSESSTESETDYSDDRDLSSIYDRDSDFERKHFVDTGGRTTGRHYRYFNDDRGRLIRGRYGNEISRKNHFPDGRDQKRRGKYNDRFNPLHVDGKRRYLSGRKRHDDGDFNRGNSSDRSYHGGDYNVLGRQKSDQNLEQGRSREDGSGLADTSLKGATGYGKETPRIDNRQNVELDAYKDEGSNDKTEKAIILDTTGLHGKRGKKYGLNRDVGSPDTYTVSYKVLEHPKKHEKHTDGSSVISKDIPKQKAMHEKNDQKAVELDSKDIKGHGYRRPKQRNDRFYDDTGDSDISIPGQKALVSKENQEAIEIDGKEIEGHGYRHPRQRSTDSHVDKYNKQSGGVKGVPRQIATDMKGIGDAIEVSDSSIEGHGYRRTPKKSDVLAAYNDKNIVAVNTDHSESVSQDDDKNTSRPGYKRETGRKKTKENKDKKGLKEKKPKDTKTLGGNYLKDTSSESEKSSNSSETTSDSDSDSGREEEFIDNGRVYTVEVETRPGGLPQSKTDPFTMNKGNYHYDYIPRGKYYSNEPLSKSTNILKSLPETKESKGKYDETMIKHDFKDLQEIKEFKDSNLEDIGDIMNYIRSVNAYGPKPRSQKHFVESKPPALGREKVKGGSLEGIKKGAFQDPKEAKLKDINERKHKWSPENDESNLFCGERDKRISQDDKDDSKGKGFLEHPIERNSGDARQRNIIGSFKPAKHKKGVVGKLPHRNKFKLPYADGTKSRRGKKAKATGSDFKGSRVNAFKRGVIPSHSGARKKEIERNMDENNKENKTTNFVDINSVHIKPEYPQNFRGISRSHIGGKNGILKGTSAAQTKDGNNKDTGVNSKETVETANPNKSVYVDEKWYGEVKSNKLGNRHGYQYILNDLNPEQSYDINVKAVAGYKRVDPDAQHVFCLSDGPISNTIPVMAPAAPRSPKLRLEGLHPEGIDVTWLAPQQHGEASISGYQMLKNGRLYGSIIPPEVNSLKIRDISLGEKITLQLIALTEHPVGKIDRRTELLEKDSGIDGSSPGEKDAEVFMGEKYAGCRPGAKLVVHYTGLVCPPSQVWCERVTGHSALIVWNRGDEPKAHFIRPESYQVTWWPGDHPEDDIQSDSTSEDHLLITNLRPATTYTVVVEARKMEKYKDVDEEAESVGRETISAFILTAKSDNLIVKTARPPDAPSNLGALATTCSAIKLAWDPPREHGVDIIGIRVDAVSLNTGDPHHVSLDVIPDATTAVIENLREKTDYMIRVTAITDEYFDRLPDKHRFKKARTIPKETILPADDSIWLPNCSILTKTSGTEPPAALKVAKASTTSLKLVWTPPIVYGSNKLQSVIVRWADVKYNKRKDDDDFVIASHVNLLPTEDTLLIEDLMPGNQYKIIVEAVVSVKTSLEKDDSTSGIEKYRRTAHIMSRPLYARTRAPTEPPVLLLTGYTQTTAQLYWEKPLLMSVVGKDAEGKPKYLRRYLEGYKLEINGRTYCHLGPASQSCQLTKCKPGKLYHVTLVALTCTEQGKKERKRKYKGAYKNTNPQDLDYGLLLEDEDNLDSSPSEPLEIILPKNQDGYIASLDTFFTHNEDRDNKTFGDVKVQWTSQGPENTVIKQHNIMWYSLDDRVVQTKFVSPDFSKASIPVTRLKSIYDIRVEPAYFTETLPQQPQNIQIMIPGPPDPPEIFLKSSSPEEFVIEWGEPRLYGGVRVRGYQVYLNDKKAGNELSSTHRKAVIPCRPNRYYKVNLVALSANPEYHDSGKSNTLSINTSLTSPREDAALDELTYVDDHEIPVKVTKVTETSIHLDWANFLEVDGVGCYKIQWSSVAQPAEREVRLSNKDTNCVINKCLPGTTHFVRLLALDEEGQIKERSKQLTVQTSAPPDGPTLSLRACNFRYIAIQWDKPNTYGDALITGYKVYVNGIVEAILNADQLSYTFTHGKWCQEYSFQVQALTSFEKMNSKPSEPLVVEWPGAKPPNINRLPTHTSSNLRVGWDDPYLTEGVKLKHFRVCCIEEDTEKMVSSIGPVHPDTREAEFKQIKKGSYNVYVEVHLYGTSEVVCSDPIKLQPAPAPDPPRIAATVVGFDERRLLEKITCDLVNKRDRLIRQVGHKLKQIGALTHPLRAEKDRDVIEGAHTLTRVEELLEDCFSALENYTGQLIAHVSWQCEQSNPDIQVSGYKILIDGKQYGNTMHEGMRTVRIKLGTDQQVFRLSMVSLTDKPSAASEESNVIDLLSETFRCFSFYCYHSIHSKGASWPDHGCCKYQDSIAYERQLAKKLANQGLLKKHVPPPSCSLLDIFEGDYKPLLQSHNRQYPTVILFWTPWCLPSQKVMTYFTRFARETTKEYNFVAVACGLGSSSAAERKSLIHFITANSWREDGTISHYTSQCASSIYEATNHIWKNTTGGIKRDPDIETESNVDLTDLLGIAGVPTFLFIHQEGYIAWHGRYSAYDYGSFAAFMRHTFSEVVAVPCPVFKCDCCKNDTTVDDETVDTIVQFTNNQSPFKNTMIRPAVIRPPSPKEEDDIEKLFVKRKHSPKRKKNKLTVNQRPFSAHTTTYAYLLKSPYMERLTPSPKTHKILMRPASSRNVQVAYETL